MGGLEGPPKPPALGDAPAEPGRPSTLLCGLGASTRSSRAPSRATCQSSSPPSSS